MAKKKKEKQESVVEEVVEQVSVEVHEEVILEAAAENTEEVKNEAAPENQAPTDLVTDINEIESALLALVFASPVALSSKKLKNILSNGGYDVSQFDLIIESLTQTYENCGIQFVKASGGYQMRTNPKHAEIVQKLVEERPQRLSKSALEVLAIVAYKQPLTRADIDHVRGTDSGHLLKSLLEKNLVRTEGHKESPGRPLLYGTTPYFLEIFSLSSLDDLPAIEEFERELVSPDTEGAALLDADPGFFDKPSGLDAEADRGDYDGRAEDVVEAPDFGEQERAREEVAADNI